MPNTTNFNWTTPADTDLVKDGAAAIRTLANGIDTSLVDLKGGTTGQVLSKATNTDLDFTWVAQDDSNAIQNAIIDAKGDLIVGTAADTPARLAVGSNDQILTADSSTASGLKWATPASSGGMTLIQETVASGASSVNFTSISGSYKQLMVVWNGIEVGSSTNFVWRFNNNSNSIYTVGARFNGQGSTMSVDNTSGFYDYATPPINSDLTSDNNQRGRGYLIIDNYASTSKYKTYWYSFAYRDGGSRNYLFMGTCLFESTSAITSLDLVRTYGSVNLSNSSNTSFRLYGIS